MQTSLSLRMLAGRFFTRAGDQAWDFAVPLTLLALWPTRLDLAALYYLLVKVGVLVLTPRVSAMIDTRPRRFVATLGLGLQLIGVVGSGVAIASLQAEPPSGVWPFTFTAGFGALVTLGMAGTLGAMLMDLTVAADLAPTLFHGPALARFNRHFRRVDLLTEVGIPVVAGVVLATAPSPLSGFSRIVIWNVVSFVPEYLLLMSVLRLRPDLASPRSTLAVSRVRFTERWRALIRHPVAPALIAYSLLWLSVLSPHGVLLTGFLRGAWQLPEWQIGIFRGAGAVFGLAATWISAFVRERRGVVPAARDFLGLQALCVIVAAVVFGLMPDSATLPLVLLFLAAILVSRIGLYGFMLGETEIRQRGIAPGERGRVNGAAQVLNNAATLVVLAFGALLPSSEDFGGLIAVSAGAVGLGFVVFLAWSRTAAAKGLHAD